MTDTRTDAHRPSAINPGAYDCLGAFYIGGSDAMADAYRGEFPERKLAYLLGLAATEFDTTVDPALIEAKLTDGNWKNKESCDHCGTRFAHGVFYLHRPTSEVVAVGHICAEETMSLPHRVILLRKRAEKAAATARKTARLADEAAAFRADHADLIAHIEAFATPLADIGEFKGNHFYASLLEKLARYGSLTPNMVAAVERNIEKDLTYRAKRKMRFEMEAKEFKVAVVEGRGPISGEVLSTKVVYSAYGSTLKMLVKDAARGFKVWGSVPSSLRGDHDGWWTEDKVWVDATRSEVKVGDTVSFTATVTRSDDDEYFGWFKRPAKATITARAIESDEHDDTLYATAIATKEAA